MNKLRDWLRRITGSEAPRMGFGAAAPSATGPKMGLLAALPSLENDVVEGALKAGAAALVVSAGLAADSDRLRFVVNRFQQCLWGLQLDSNEVPVPDTGFDFLLLSPSSALSALGGKETGRLLAIDPSWDDVQLRVLDHLPLDGVVFPLALSEKEHPRLEHLLAVRRLSLLQRKPLIAELSRSLSADDLGILRDGGLVGLLVSSDTRKWAETVKELSKATEALPARGKVRRDVDVVLPFISSGHAPKTEEEEEEP